MTDKPRIPPKLPISGCVITFNEERNVRDCLESLSFCSEIVVVDSFSKDRTLEICREYTSRIFEHRYQGNISQKNFALQRVKYDWVLSLDADERVSPQLREEIAREFAKGFAGCSGYRMRRHVFYLGKWINHCGWYPDYKLRLFRKSNAHFSGVEPHDTVITNGNVKKLKGEIHHFPCANLSEHLDTIDRYSRITAANLPACSTGKAVLLLMVTPLAKVLEMYVFKRGFLDGVRGVLICFISAFSRFLRYAKVIELNFSREKHRR